MCLCVCVCLCAHVCPGGIHMCTGARLIGVCVYVYMTEDSLSRFSLDAIHHLFETGSPRGPDVAK